MKLWILYDERAHTMGSDAAQVMVSCDSEAEAVSYLEDFPRAAIFEYDVAEGNKLINEKYRPDLGEAGSFW